MSALANFDANMEVLRAWVSEGGEVEIRSTKRTPAGRKPMVVVNLKKAVVISGYSEDIGGVGQGATLETAIDFAVNAVEEALEDPYTADYLARMSRVLVALGRRSEP